MCFSNVDYHELEDPERPKDTQDLGNLEDPEQAEDHISLISGKIEPKITHSSGLGG